MSPVGEGFRGKGQVKNEGVFVANVDYDVQVFDGQMNEGAEPTAGVIGGRFSVISRPLPAGATLTLHMEDARQVDFRMVSSNCFQAVGAIR